MSRPMTFAEFANVVNYVQRNNSPFVTRLANTPCVKYIDPHFDMRSNTVFSIVFRGFGPEKVLHCQNECMDLPDSLHDRCMAFLKGVGGW